MGFLAPALPWIIKGGSLAAGMLAGRKATSSAMARSPEEQAALAGGQGAAGGLATSGANLLKTGVENVTPATNYYQTLLHGNRALQSQAVAAPRGALTDVYTGAERGLEKSGVRGAQRDVASGELARQKAGQISSLITGVQPGAASALSQIGLEQTGQGGSQLAHAGSLYGGLLGQGTSNRYYGRQEGEKAGQGIGGFLFDILSGMGGKRGGGARGGIPNLGAVNPFSLPGWSPGP